MILKVSNITDFLAMIADCILNNGKEIRVFMSYKPCDSNVSILDNDDSKPFTSFTFVLFTNLYQVVYGGILPTAEFAQAKNSLLHYQDDNAGLFRINVFEGINVDYEKNLIEISKELDVI